MEVTWITKNYGDDLYLQCTYTCIRVFDERLAHASKKDKVRSGRDERTSMSSVIPEKNCSSEHATVEESAVSVLSST
ncbi:unnamed protein product [Angiostrongylus costaricensis]|uniref:Uncharacterized protein n=1 Tax=Angiostrongylus costaricensis TaxID=334426 RepID=A0A0R3PG99_ANGCS|nr:unnamed protein product [Angiostrongylus costaricensis]